MWRFISPRLTTTPAESESLMVTKSTEGTSQVQGATLPAKERRHFVAEMCQLTGLGNTSINKYAKIAGVPTAIPGDRNFRWTDAEAIKILTAVLAGSNEVKVTEHCRTALERLRIKYD